MKCIMEKKFHNIGLSKVHYVFILAMIWHILNSYN